MADATLNGVPERKFRRSSFLLHPKTRQVLTRLCDHYKNSEQGLIEYAVSQFDDHVEIDLPSGRKSVKVSPQMSDEGARHLDALAKSTGLKKGEVVRRAIHQLEART